MKTELSRVRIALVLSAVLWFVGCETTSRFKSEVDPNADISQYKTFAMMPLPESIPNADPGIVLRLGPTALETVESELTVRGFQKVEMADADFTVRISGQIVPKVDVTDWGYQPYGMYVGAGRWGRIHPYTMGYPNVDVDSYDEGTVTVEFYDATTKKMVWVGWTTSRTQSSGPDLEDFKASLIGIMSNVPSLLASVESAEK